MACFPRGKAGGAGDKILLPLELPGASANRGFNASWSRLSHVLALFVDCTVLGHLAARKNLDGRNSESRGRLAGKFNKAAGILSRIHAQYTLRFRREIVVFYAPRVTSCASPATRGPILRPLLLILWECILRHGKFFSSTSRSVPAPRSAFD